MFKGRARIGFTEKLGTLGYRPTLRWGGLFIILVVFFGGWGLEGGRGVPGVLTAGHSATVSTAINIHEL